MSGEKHPGNRIQRCKAFASTVFAPREMFLRSGDRFRYMQLSAQLQQGIVGMGAMMFIWILYISGNYAAQEIDLAEKNQQIRKQSHSVIVLRTELNKANRQHALATTEITEIGKALSRATALNKRLANERRSFEQRLREVKRQLAEFHAAEGSVVKRLSERTRLALEDMEEAINMTGLEISTLIGSVNNESMGQGGAIMLASQNISDFTPDIHFEVAISTLSQQLDRWEALQMILRALPLSRPIMQFRVSSRYGGRKDPLNGREAWHDGVDLAAPAGTPIYATAPGRVVFAGSRNSLGRMVEIDHGYGIHTRYAHLQKVLVKSGQDIENRDRIGLVGTSGRSTGPHVHYEVRHNGRAKDPFKFMTAGDYLFKR